MTFLLETKNLTINFGGHTAVNSVTVQIPEKNSPRLSVPMVQGKPHFLIY